MDRISPRISRTRSPRRSRTSPAAIPDAFAIAFDAYSWDNVADTNDAEFDSIRALLAALGYDLEDL